MTKKFAADGSTMKNEQLRPDPNGNVEVATLGGGCFWCTEAAFQEIRGVVNIESGYAGGITESPTYEQVCSGATGHAEVVQVTFDPDTVSFKEILERPMDIPPRAEVFEEVCHHMNMVTAEIAVEEFRDFRRIFGLDIQDGLVERA